MKKTRLRKKGKSERAKLIREIDRLHSLYIRNRDKYCVTCGTSKDLQCGHLFTRVNHSTRWDTAPDGNAHAQCASDNYRHEYDPYKFTNWYIKRFGVEKYDELHRRHITTRRYTMPELRELRDELKRLVEEGR